MGNVDAGKAELAQLVRKHETLFFKAMEAIKERQSPSLLNVQLAYVGGKIGALRKKLSIETPWEVSA